MMTVLNFLNSFATQLPLWALALLSVVLICFTGFRGFGIWGWVVTLAVVFSSWGAPLWLWTTLGVVAVLFGVYPLRTVWISKPLMKLIDKMGLLPKVSETEKSALDAGTVWAEAEYFSAKPDFAKLLKDTYSRLTDEEKAFLDGPVEDLCAACNDWDVTQNRGLSTGAWDIIRKEKFFGMIIPKEYGGLGFSAFAHSEVIHKLSSRCTAACITVMVPNSLGPAELLVHYGTQKQKDYFLPKLAVADEIPCFALTEPQAGSDAASIKSSGVLFKNDDGRLSVKLNWDKRYITLGAIATTVGLAFQMFDPDGLLGGEKYIGITCALVPSNLPGVVNDKRHDPLGVPFYNCPLQGTDVIIDVEDHIVGGEGGIGKGWGMLMESLAAGRGISLPAQGTGGAKMGLLYTSAYAAIRKQFGINIGKFEGIAEPLAEIAGLVYMMEGNRRYICGALDDGKKPPVVTALAKYNYMEVTRTVLLNCMDIVAGAAISAGPRNMFMTQYNAMPIGITVEGANILTRTLIVYGQGLLRGHPYLQAEVNAVEAGDAKAFDRAFWGHQAHIVNALFRSVLLSLTRGRLASVPSGPNKRFLQKLSWASATFAITANVSLALGGQLKLKEMLSGRFADILSWLFLATGTIRRWEADGRPKEHEALVDWVCYRALHRIQLAFDGIFANLKIPGLTWFLSGVVRSWSNANPLSTIPSDKLNSKISQFVQTPGEMRRALFEGIYIPKDENEQLARVENAFYAQMEANALFAKVKKYFKSKKIKRRIDKSAIEDALKEGVITAEEKAMMQKAAALVLDAIQVDDFTEDEFMNRSLRFGETNVETRETLKRYSEEKLGRSSTATAGSTSPSRGDNDDDDSSKFSSAT